MLLDPVRRPRAARKTRLFLRRLLEQHRLNLALTTGSFSLVIVVGIDAATGSLVVGGKKVFPIVLSNGPPATSLAPSGRNALAEVAAAGVGFLRTGNGNWTTEFLAGQIQNERKLLDAAAAHGLRCWTWLGRLPNLPTSRLHERTAADAGRERTERTRRARRLGKASTNRRSEGYPRQGSCARTSGCRSSTRSTRS